MLDIALVIHKKQFNWSRWGDDVVSFWLLLDTEERWLVSGIAASSVGAEADSRGFSRVDITLWSARHQNIYQKSSNNNQ